MPLMRRTLLQEKCLLRSKPLAFWRVVASSRLLFGYNSYFDWLPFLSKPVTPPQFERKLNSGPRVPYEKSWIGPFKADQIMQEFFSRAQGRFKGSG